MSKANTVTKFAQLSRQHRSANAPPLFIRAREAMICKKVMKSDKLRLNISKNFVFLCTIMASYSICMAQVDHPCHTEGFGQNNARGLSMEEPCPTCNVVPTLGNIICAKHVIPCPDSHNTDLLDRQHITNFEYVIPEAPSLGNNGCWVKIECPNTEGC